MEQHEVPLGGEFQIHQLEIPKLGSRWKLSSFDESFVKPTCELLDVGPALGDGAMRKFVFSSVNIGYSEIKISHYGADDSIIESVSYGVDVVV